MEPFIYDLECNKAQIHSVIFSNRGIKNALHFLKGPTLFNYFKQILFKKTFFISFTIDVFLEFPP